MCAPAIIGIATAMVGVAQSVMQFQAQKADYKNNARAARQALIQEQRQLTLRQIQEEESTAQKKHQTLLEGASKRAEIQVAGDAAGAAGLSLEHVLSEVDRRTNENLNNLDRNYEMTAEQIQQEQKAAVEKAKGRVASVSRPSPFGLVAGIAGNALQGFTAYRQMAVNSAGVA